MSEVVELGRHRLHWWSGRFALFIMLNSSASLSTSSLSNNKFRQIGRTEAASLVSSQKLTAACTPCTFVVVVVHNIKYYCKRRAIACVHKMRRIS